MCIEDCGLFGQCQESICVCQEGWTNSFESMIFLDRSIFQNETLFSQLPCTRNENLLLIIYSFLVATSSTLLVILMLSLPRDGTWKRFSFSILSTVFILALAIYKVSNRDPKAVFGNDVFIALFATGGLALSYLGIYLLFYKYIIYNLQVSGKASRFRFHTFLLIMTALAFLLQLLGLLSARGTLGVALFKSGVVIVFLSTLWVIYLFKFQMDELVDSIQHVNKSLLNMSDKKSIATHFRFIQRINLVAYIWVAVLLLLGALTKVTVRLFIYWIPLMFIVLNISLMASRLLFVKSDALYRNIVEKSRRPSADV